MNRRLGAELGVVVLGVVLALGAESWRQERSDLRRAQEYVGAVHSDMMEFRSTLDSTIAVQRADVESTSNGLALLSADAPVPDTLTISRWVFGTVSVPIGTLDALVQTGDVNRIRDEDLRLTIVRARSELAELQTRLRVDMGSENFRLLVAAGERVRVEQDLDPFSVPTVLSMRGNTDVTAAYRTHLLESTGRLRQLEQLEEVVTQLVLAIEVSGAGEGAT